MAANTVRRCLPTLSSHHAVSIKSLIFLGLYLFCGTNALAHDIGVSRAELRERAVNHYLLRVQAGVAKAAAFPAPELPHGFQFTANPRGIQAGPWKVFEFSGDRPLTAGDELVLPWQRDGIMIKVFWADGSQAKGLFKNVAGVITLPMAEIKAGSGSWWAAAGRYLMLGIEHILSGVDHLLFVFGLMLLVGGGWALVKTITAFTIAHSATLGLATLGFVHLRSGPVEAAIALSIVFLAVEIVHVKQGRAGLSKDYPWVVAFGFGLLHGLGFAGALSEIGLPQNEIPQALLFFNVGVEIGQLAFVALIFPLVWLLARMPWRLPKWAEMAPAYAVGAIAMAWFGERLIVMYAS